MDEISFLCSRFSEPFCEMIVDAAALLHKYIDPNDALFDIVFRHSRHVADKAIRLAAAHPELNLDVNFLEEAALLHDIGVAAVSAPEIFCFGSEPYLLHGLLGAKMLRGEGLERHARVCERHTGTGLTVEEIIRRDLPLPHQDFSPETLEEQLICFADKFFSKTRPDVERTVEVARAKLEKFGEESLRRFDKWCELFL